MERKLFITYGLGLANLVLLEQILVSFQRLELLADEDAIGIVEDALQDLETQQAASSADHAPGYEMARKALERLVGKVRKAGRHRDPPYWKPPKNAKPRRKRPST